VATNFRAIVEALLDGGVDVAIIGGVALVARGAPRTTEDIDFCYARDDANLERLARALAPLRPYLRDAPPGLPFTLDPPTLKAGLNFTLTTSVGDVDLLGEVSGIGAFDEVKAASSNLSLYGRSVAVLELAGLKRAKTAAGRVKDLADLAFIAELEKRRGSSARD
jgi:hypothetical protein